MFVSVCIELLQQYLVALQKASDVQAEYDSHMEYLQSPEMKVKRKELKQQEDQLKDVEQKIGKVC